MKSSPAVSSRSYLIKTLRDKLRGLYRHNSSDLENTRDANQNMSQYTASVRNVALSTDHNVPWYIERVPPLPSSTRNLLENYGHIPSNEIEQHLLDIRERAWQVFPFPCIGKWRFLDLSISLAPQYPDILHRLKEDGETLLDLGCCFAQDLRKLVADGVPQTQLLGVDKETRFFELGYALFRDEGSFTVPLLRADVFDESPLSPLARHVGAVDMIHAASVFHLFSHMGQLKLADACVRLLKKRPGSLVFGRQAGMEQASSVFVEGRGEIWRHNEQSFKTFWEKDVAERTGRAFETWVEWDAEANDGAGAGSRMMRFAVWMR